MSNLQLLIIILVVVFLLGGGYGYRAGWGNGPISGLGLLVIILIVLLLVGPHKVFAGALTINELKAATPPDSLEGLFSFLMQLPTSREAAICYASFIIAMPVGMGLSWAWKYFKTKETDSGFIDYFFRSSSRRTGATVLTFGAATVGAIMAGVFSNEGVFVGWWNVIYSGITLALGLDLGINQGNTRVFTPAEREVARAKIEDKKEQQP